jgi:hypothetical protein
MDSRRLIPAPGLTSEYRSGCYCGAAFVQLAAQLDRAAEQRVERIRTIAFIPHPHAFKRNISATSSGVFITCPRGSFHDGLAVIRSSFIRPLLGYPRRGQFSMARQSCLLRPGKPTKQRRSPLCARLYEPRAIRGSPRSATCQNRRLKLSTIRGALQCGSNLGAN